MSTILVRTLSGAVYTIDSVCIEFRSDHFILSGYRGTQRFHLLKEDEEKSKYGHMKLNYYKYLVGKALWNNLGRFDFNDHEKKDSAKPYSNLTTNLREVPEHWSNSWRTE